MTGPSEAFYVAVAAMATVIPAPFPVGLNTAEVGDWLLTINTGKEPLPFGDGPPIAPFEVRATNTRYLAFATLDPGGGLIGGMTEGQFIAGLAPFGAIA